MKKITTLLAAIAAMAALTACGNFTKIEESYNTENSHNTENNHRQDDADFTVNCAQVRADGGQVGVTHEADADVYDTDEFVLYVDGDAIVPTVTYTPRGTMMFNEEVVIGANDTSAPKIISVRLVAKSSGGSEDVMGEGECSQPPLGSEDGNE